MYGYPKVWSVIQFRNAAFAIITLIVEVVTADYSVCNKNQYKVPR